MNVRIDSPGKTSAFVDSLPHLLLSLHFRRLLTSIKGKSMKTTLQRTRLHVHFAREGTRGAKVVRRRICSEKFSTVLGRTTVQRHIPHYISSPLHFFWPSEHPEHLRSHPLLLSRGQRRVLLESGGKHQRVPRHRTAVLAQGLQPPCESWPRLLAP